MAELNPVRVVLDNRYLDWQNAIAVHRIGVRFGRSNPRHALRGAATVRRSGSNARCLPRQPHRDRNRSTVMVNWGGVGYAGQ
jgi:hypothetical protein